MSKNCNRNSSTIVDADQSLPQESLERISARLAEIGLILSAGDLNESPTLDSIRRFGCHLCGQLGHAGCTATSIAAGCPLAVARGTVSSGPGTP